MSNDKLSVAGDFLEAKRVAIIGATAGARDTWSYNARMTRSLLRSSFDDVVLISRRETIIHGRRAYSHISELHGDDGDLCVVLVPHEILPATVADCAQAGWRRVLAITGSLDASDRKAIKEIVPSSARLWGPNCTGFICLETNRRVMASDYEPVNRQGRRRIAVAGQSGGALNNMAMLAQGFGVNISHIMSTGEEMDVGIEDLLAFLAHSRSTDGVIIFVEQARHPAALLEALDACAGSEIPVMVLKIGRTQRAVAAAETHSGALVGDADEFDALVRQHAGIICESFREAAGVASVTVHSRRRPGRRVAFFTTSGGTGALICDQAERHGLRFADLSPTSSEIIRGLALPEVDSINPFDSAVAGGTPKSLPQHLDAVNVDEGVDTMMLLHGGDVYGELITNQLESHMPSAKTLLAVWPGAPANLRERLLDAGIAVLDDPGESCRWLGLAARPPDLSDEERHRSADAANPSASIYLDYGEASRLLRKSEIDAPRQWYADSPGELDGIVAAADRFPVFVKATTMPGHKALAGGVRGGIRSPAELKRAAAELMAGHGPIVIEEEAPPGIEVLVAVHDGPLGGIVLVGLGGPYADAFGKQVVLPASSDVHTVARAVAGSPIASVLVARSGREYLAEGLTNIAVAATELVKLCRAEGLARVEVNPLIVSVTRAVACDVKIELGQQQTEKP
jgi:acyl-CoA synthetase (NDP forming)